MISNSKPTSRKGFMLIEVLIALLIMTIIITALTPLFVSSFDLIFQAGTKSRTLYSSQAIIDGEIVNYVYGTGQKLDLVFSGTNHEVWGRKLDVSLLTTFLSEPLLRTRYVAVGDSRTIITSPNGETWHDETHADLYPYNLHDVTWGGKFPQVFVAVGQWGTILSSTEGDNWSKVNDSGYDLNSVVWGGPEGGMKFVAVGNGGTILASTDASVSSWADAAVYEDIYATFTGKINDISWGVIESLSIGLFVAVGDDGVILTSQTGNLWKRYNIGVENLYSVTWINDSFVVVGQNGTIIYSEDGVNWAQYAGTGDLQSVAWGNGRFICVGSEGIFYLPVPGFLPELKYYVPFSSYNDITWSYNKFVTVGNNAEILTSSDGDTWEPQIGPVTVTNNLNSIIGR